MTVSGRLLRLDDAGTRDPVSGKTVFADPQVLWQGSARIRASTGGSTVQADRVVTLGGYLLVLPADCPAPRVRDMWEVDGCAGDPSLERVRLRVVDVPRSGLSWQRNVGCDIEEPSARRG